MDLIEAPKIGRKLPDVLSVKEIDKMLASIDVGSRLATQLAILETLYGSGLPGKRTRELKISDLRFDEGLVLITGKETNSDWCPLGKLALKKLRVYIEEIRVHVPVKKGHKTLFSSIRTDDNSPER